MLKHCTLEQRWCLVVDGEVLTTRTTKTEIEKIARKVFKRMGSSVSGLARAERRIQRRKAKERRHA